MKRYYIGTPKLSIWSYQKYFREFETKDYKFSFSPHNECFYFSFGYDLDRVYVGKEYTGYPKLLKWFNDGEYFKVNQYLKQILQTQCDTT